MSEVRMTPTDAMIEAALAAWYVHPAMKTPQGADHRDMRAALTAALAVSGYGKVVEALRGLLLVVEKSFEPSVAALDNSGWVEGRHLKDFANTARTALSLLTPAITTTIVSQGN